MRGSSLSCGCCAMATGGSATQYKTTDSFCPKDAEHVTLDVLGRVRRIAGSRQAPEVPSVQLLRVHAIIVWAAKYAMERKVYSPESTRRGGSALYRATTLDDLKLADRSPKCYSVALEVLALDKANAFNREELSGTLMKQGLPQVTPMCVYGKIQVLLVPTRPDALNSSLARNNQVENVGVS